MNHHLDCDHELREQLNGEFANQVDPELRRKEQLKQIRLTNKDFRTYGYSDNCPKCRDLEMGPIQVVQSALRRV